MDRISTKTDVARVGDEPDEWQEFLDGERGYDDLSDQSDQRRAAFFGLVGDDGKVQRA